MSNKKEPIKVIIELTDETVDLCAFVTKVLEFENDKKDCEEDGSKKTTPAE
jgi:hypothetical protein